ncbi:FtsX-like permease family protein [Streptomyces sp. S.PB5]|uniref:FtsX-like permease family protein n=1 Tax=Streptomyces sp. S.PB5 TaxID=3020844 RepID=UPI0025B0F69E|nr:FtsX-like permease family protein [Streptomyces sp. S.PB5]MDN3022844.1 ABC transporter permease [Streptomyces sp. S.PB5]
MSTEHDPGHEDTTTGRDDTTHRNGTAPDIRRHGNSAADDAPHSTGPTDPAVPHPVPDSEDTGPDAAPGSAGLRSTPHDDPVAGQHGTSPRPAGPDADPAVAPGTRTRTRTRTRTKGTVRADLRLAWLLTRGSDRREWWRVGLTAAGAALATGFALTAVSLAALQGRYQVSVGAGLLNEPGERSGVIVTLLLLLIAVFGFLGQCARIGAVHRDRRLAGLRLAGASARQVRRIAALETGLACLLGSLLATAVSVVVLLSLWREPTALAWTGTALVGLGVPVLGAAAGALALRRVVASPLGWVRRVRPRSGPGYWLLLAGGVLLVALVALAAVASTSTGVPDGGGLRYAEGPLTVAGLLLLVGVGAVGLVGVTARLTGRLLARKARTAATLIAAERLDDDPWAAARTHAAVLLITVAGTGYLGIRQVMLTELTWRNERSGGYDMGFYTAGLNLTAVALVIALLLTLAGLAVGTAESLATRRRGLAAQTAAGVPHQVLGRALLLETALPLAPALLLGGTGGMAIGVAYARILGDGPAVTPYAALLVPLVVHAACLLAAATSLPLLRRTLNPAELRYA